MNGPTIKNFLDELEKINGSQDVEKHIECTKALLAVGDEVLKGSKIINDRIENGSFRPTICGATYIEEISNGSLVKRPVVDLVQQGGTMLGIGLLGYTYVMERAGVRFRSMAGTSAGAINTLLLSAFPEKIYQEQSPFDSSREAVKSEMLAYLVANKDFSTFLDRNGLIGTLQHWLVNHIKGVGKILRVFKIVFPLLLLGVSYLIYRFLDSFLFNTGNNLTENEVNNYNFIIGTLGIMAVLTLVFVMLFSLFRKNMGINAGLAPYKWMKSILETAYVNIPTTQALLDKKQAEPKPQYVKDGQTNTITTNPRIVFITANLTHNRIVKFPENNIDYWDRRYANQVCPAAYVRASMSLPFIFYAFIPSDDHVQDPDLSSPKNTVSLLARFVDGGMLSNFPIREFHVPQPEVPNYPTFGVLLGSPPAEPQKDNNAIVKKFHELSFFKFLLSFISTFRSFYDADFLRSHNELNMLVRAVDTDAFNSLDFGMDFETKKAIFKAGATTAIEQLEKFDWEKYLSVRIDSPLQTQNAAV